MPIPIAAAAIRRPGHRPTANTGRARILVVDDDPGIRSGICTFLAEQGYCVSEAADCQGAANACRQATPDAALIDYVLPDGNAISLLGHLLDLDAQIPVAILTAHGSIQTAVQAMQLGAADFVSKPVEPESLAKLLERLVARRRRSALPSPAGKPVDPLVGTSDAIVRLREETQRLLHTRRPLLLLGETGTGKTTLARWIHRHGPRAEQPFVSLNCAGFKPEFLETELFGHQRGAFTGAVSEKEGLLEVADGGTVLLDEIADMDLSIQPKLLAVLEEGSFRRLGELRQRSVDLRLLAATNQDLAGLVEQGVFRRDLYFRVAALSLTLPPLRDRHEDIEPLALQFLEECAAELESPPLRLSPEACVLLRRWPWPGNVRELRNVVERLALTHPEDGAISAEMLSRELETPNAKPTLGAPTAGAALLSGPEQDLRLATVERHHLERVLGLHGGHVGRTAAALGVPRSTLYNRLRRHGLRAGPTR